MTDFSLFNLSFEEIASYASEIGQQSVLTNTNILVNPTLNPNAKNPPQKPGLTFFCLEHIQQHMWVFLALWTLRNWQLAV